MKPSEFFTCEAKVSRGCYARNSAGSECSAFSPHAVRLDVETVLKTFEGMPFRQAIGALMATPTWSQWVAENGKAPYPATRDLAGFNDTVYFHALRQALIEAKL